MNRRAPLYVTGALAALGLLALAVGAGAQPNSTSTTTIYTSSADVTPVMLFEQERTQALRSIVDAGITNYDLMKVLPLLRDLRNMEDNYRSDVYYMNHEILTAHSASDLDRAERKNIDDVNRHYNSKRDRIWHAIADRIGQTKADALRGTCEPMQDRTALYVPDEHMVRIDQYISKWDEIHPGLYVASTTTTVTPVGMAHRTYVVPLEPAPLTYRSLVDLCEQKVASGYGAEPAAWYFGSWYAKDFTSPDARYVRDRAFRYWEW